MLEKQLSEAWIQEDLGPPIQNARHSGSPWLQARSPDEQAERAPLLPECFYFPLRRQTSRDCPTEGELAGLWLNQNTSGSARPPHGSTLLQLGSISSLPETQTPGEPTAQASTQLAAGSHET